MNDYSRSIILIPTLHEKENLEKLIPGIFNLMPDVSILIVDDNSGDGTQELISSMSSRFKNLFILNRKNERGYGRSSIEGFKWVFHPFDCIQDDPELCRTGQKRYDYLVTMDADFSHDFKVAPILIDELKFADMVVGSRYIQGGGIKNWNLFRRILSRFANFYVRQILGLPVTDATSGFNAYRINALRALNLEEIKSDGYAFLVELKYKLFRSGRLFKESPIIFSERREGKSKMSSKIIWEAIRLPWKLKFKI